MASPKVTHGGFLVPNAGGLPYPRMAEVDQIDLNTLSQSGWAVIEGCQVFVSGTTATVDPGTVLIDGVRVPVPGGSAVLGSGGQQDRFDLVVATHSGIKVIPGTASFDPVLPDPGLEETTLAAVFCPTGSSSFTDNVIDKRVMAPRALITAPRSGRGQIIGEVPGAQTLIQNVYEGENYFYLRGDGRMEWKSDAIIYREAPETLRIINHLNVAGRFKAGEITSLGPITAAGPIDSQNIYMSDTPKGGDPLGTLRQGTDGRIWVLSQNGWVEIATVENASPLGTIISSVEPPSEMAEGWVPLNGITVSEQDQPTLFTLTKLQPFISGNAPDRTMVMPDMTDRVLMGTQGNLAFKGSATAALITSNLPPHKHNVRVLVGGGFSPTGSVSPGGAHVPTQNAGSGQHGHPLNDPGHAHDGFEGPMGTQSQVVALVWGGRNKIDALFNDRNHTYSVEALLWTRRAFTGITIGSSGSEHTHVMNGVPDHTHALTLNPVPEHGHNVNETEVGLGTPFSIRQESFSVYMYIKA